MALRLLYVIAIQVFGWLVPLGRGQAARGVAVALATALSDAIGERRPHYGRCDRHAG